MERLASPLISQVVVTNAVRWGQPVDSLRPKLVELCVGRLLGEAINRIHNNLSVSALFQQTAGTKR